MPQLIRGAQSFSYLVLKGKTIKKKNQQYHLKLCANLPLQVLENFLLSSDVRPVERARTFFKVASSRVKYYTNSKSSVLSVLRVGGRKNMFTT